MRRALLAAAATVAILFPGNLLRAELKWEKTQEQFDVSASQDVFVARYPFVNAGDKPVTIKNVKTSCGCTSAKLAKEVYAPGERDDVIVSFLLRGRRGPQEKHISVKTDDPKSDVELLLKGNIEELATVKPVFLLWRKDSQPEWKTSVIDVRQTDPMQIVEVQPSSEAFEYELNRIESGRRYELRVRPITGTAQAATCVFEMKTDTTDHKSLYVHARIK
jgi:hypothetical protein